ncbi:hypothetical protein A3E04_01645 [Candidatus Kuenenbacteria bacterium RIFCSPHIGHO2_12_FULL_42_14]|uniref:Uncharacterized protein n=3 Tax=Candidatus Kueneniibacteriota TaxID=1752740 RepID=A0A0G0YS12_9BACT|nr:MAG: hypothetical protein UV02_C0069G0006 [Candidatus Kuenenbacteria bacterium GW2011_GWA2_42_15]OGG95972.1 MAG: hypothetical protein A2V95_02435 [Candidatus Kuenenbacteria bacterium RBG_16_41_7]OGG98830.1 MAG: hypothetical protein A3E04_01645 [Candidatus Kuenenbacteria bacterium RIFCSPHIGHO2_12_FULL_42_14]
MAGQKIVIRKSAVGDGLTDQSGALLIGLTIVEIIENGNVEPGDEWGLFRLTDDGLAAYKIGAEVAAGIMGLKIGGEPAVQEIVRYMTENQAKEARNKFPVDERNRILIRSVRPKNNP